ncbi:unnamed protein product, partial [Rotaria sp. Silwood2]
MEQLTNATQTQAVRHIDNTFVPYLSLKTENNLVDFIIVVIDSLIETSEDCKVLISDLQNYVHNSVNAFTNFDQSLTFIQNNHTLKIFLIIAGNFGEQYGHHFFELSQIECVYVFCHDCEKHGSWANQVQKMRGVFVDKTQLLTIVCQDVKNFGNRWSFFEGSSFQKASTDDGLWYQLFIKIVMEQPRTSDAWQEMLNECRSYYRNDSLMLKKVDEFENNYAPDKAINYYSQDSFIYRIVNCALRTQNIDIAIKFRTYIGDLYRELRKWHWRRGLDFNKNKTELPIHVVYRGEYVQEQKLEQLKGYCVSRNAHITLNVFGSTTRDPETALGFIPCDRPGSVRCLYQIFIRDNGHITTIASSVCCRMFLGIEDFSVMPKEQEVLFCVGSHFHVKYIGKMTSERSWVPIVLELDADRSGFADYWHVWSARIGEESDEMKHELLHLVHSYTTKKDEVNWRKWWQEFRRKTGCRKQFDEPLVVTMYECFDDLESIVKAVDLRKRCFINTYSDLLHSNENNLNFFLTNMKSGKSTRIIAVYELFLQFSNGMPNRTLLPIHELAQIHQYAGDADATFHFYHNHALDSYKEALKLTEQNSDEQTMYCLKDKINKLMIEKSTKKTGQQRN